MPKYIITDDLNKFVFNDDADIEQYDNIKGHILKQSDTIEKLCDYFMLVRTNKNSFPVDFKQLSRAKKVQQQLKIDTTLYGAVWTSKGLIYVAKMNEKGELVLI